MNKSKYRLIMDRRLFYFVLHLFTSNWKLKRVWEGGYYFIISVFNFSHATPKRIVCYYTNWSAYRPGRAKFLPVNINPYLCTHLIYSFAGLTNDYKLKPFDKWQDIDQGNPNKRNYSIHSLKLDYFAGRWIRKFQQTENLQWKFEDNSGHWWLEWGIDQILQIGRQCG